MPAKEDLSIKQRKFIKGIVSGLSQREAMEKAGYSSATRPGVVMNRPAVQNFLHRHMEQAGINDALLAQKLREGLNAKTPPKKEGGQRYDDQFVRKQFLDIIFKIRGDYAPERSENISKSIHITLDRGMLEALKDSRFIDGREADILEAEIVGDVRELPESTEPEK